MSSLQTGVRQMFLSIFLWHPRSRLHLLRLLVPEAPRSLKNAEEVSAEDFMHGTDDDGFVMPCKASLHAPPHCHGARPTTRKHVSGAQPCPEMSPCRPTFEGAVIASICQPLKKGPAGRAFSAPLGLKVLLQLQVPATPMRGTVWF